MSTLLNSFLVRRALTQPFSGRMFDICPLNDLSSAYGFNLASLPEHQVVRAFHCMNFEEMPLNVKLELFRQYGYIVAKVIGVEITAINDDMEYVITTLPMLKA